MEGDKVKVPVLRLRDDDAGVGEAFRPLGVGPYNRNIRLFSDRLKMFSRPGYRKSHFVGVIVLKSAQVCSSATCGDI